MSSARERREEQTIRFRLGNAQASFVRTALEFFIIFCSSAGTPTVHVRGAARRGVAAEFAAETVERRFHLAAGRRGRDLFLRWSGYRTSRMGNFLSVEYRPFE